MRKRSDPSPRTALNRLNTLSSSWTYAQTEALASSCPGKKPRNPYAKARRIWRRLRKINSVLHRIGRSLQLGPLSLCTLLAEGYAWQNPLLDLHLLTDPHLRAVPPRHPNPDFEVEMLHAGLRAAMLRKFLAEIHSFHNVPSVWRTYLRSPATEMPPSIRPHLLDEHAHLACVLHEELWDIAVRLATFREGPPPWEHLHPYKKSGAIVTLCDQGAVAV